MVILLQDFKFGTITKQDTHIVPAAIKDSIHIDFILKHTVKSHVISSHKISVFRIDIQNGCKGSTKF